MQVFVAPRITLKPLVPTFPCFSKIYVSLMDKVCDHKHHYCIQLVLLGSMSHGFSNMCILSLSD